jgi:hypothetical protein
MTKLVRAGTLPLKVTVYNINGRHIMTTKEFREKVAMLEQWDLSNFWWGLKGEDNVTMKEAIEEFPDLKIKLKTKIVPAMQRSRRYQVSDTVRFEKGIGDSKDFFDPTIPKGAVGKIISMTYMEYQMSVVIVIDDTEYTITRPIGGPRDTHPSGLDITSIDGQW